MDGIAMGTTPTIKINIPDLDFGKVQPKTFNVYFYQGSEINFKKEGEEVFYGIEDRFVQVYLSQNETLKLNPNKPLKIEVRWLFIDELPSSGELKAGKTNILSIPVTETLKKEVIEWRIT